MQPSARAFIGEVGPRDGLQIIRHVMPTETKKRWISAEATAGVQEIEVCSFVSPKVLPQFADAEEVVRHALSIPGLTVAVLAPNLKGVERAIASGAHKVTIPVSATDGHSLANVRKTREQQVEQVRLAGKLCRQAGRDVELCAGISCAFGCTIEGVVAEREVLWLAGELVKAGATDISLADSVGFAGPAQIRSLFKAVRAEIGASVTTAHLHDTRGLGLANVLAAMDVDIWSFDSSLGGLGGCPYSPGATGNVSTEDLAFMFDTMGIETGVDLEKLLVARQIMQGGVPGEILHGKLGQAGLPKGYVAARHAA